MKKTTLITGASGGIGYEFAKLAAKDGNNLVLVDIREKELGEAANALLGDYPGIEIKTILTDLAEQPAAQYVFDQVQAAGWQVDILINNAGYGVFGFFYETDWNREGRMIILHVYTLTHLTKLFLPGMVRRGYGKVLNIASMAAFQPGPLMALYYSTKAYVLSFTEAIANELIGTGVTATVLCPGMTPTGFQSTVGSGESKLTKKKLLSTTATEVAEYGYKAMHSGKVVAIPGIINYILANANRLVPRKMVTAILRKGQEKNRK